MKFLIHIKTMHWAVIVSSIWLTACSLQQEPRGVNVFQDTEEQHNLTTLNTSEDEIIKSINDERQYSSIVLENQLELILVSDPSIEKSAIALSVAVGSLQEPKEFGGLAHYLEHMLMLNSKSYPDVNDFNEFISRYGGIRNAETRLNQTNFMLAVNNDAFDQALSRFSSFFYEASLDQKYADKERNAVHAEWSIKSPNDWVILEQLNGITLNPEHPISQFNWGNLDSLADKGDKKLHAAMLKLYQTFYSANLIKGAMISHLPIADMKILAKKYFGEIPNKRTPKPLITVPVAKPEQLKKIIHYVPQSDMQQLRINFVVSNNAEQFVLKPNGFVNYLLNNEMPGTLASVLRDAGFSHAVYSNYDANAYGNAGSFSVYIDLTESGLQNRDKVMGATLKYLDLLREKGVDERFFKEIKQSLSNKFRFKEKANDYNYALQIASALHEVPVQYVLSSQYEFQRFEAKAIQSVLNQLTIENARVFYIDKGQQADQPIQYFPGRYRTQSISTSMQDHWLNLAAEFDLSLPRANSLMPEKFELTKRTYTNGPVKLETQGNYTAHIGHSALFEQPKGIVVFDFNSDILHSGIKNEVLGNLFIQALHQNLVELVAESNAAGMGLFVGLSNGLSVTMSGFSDKQPLLLRKVVQQIESFNIDEQALLNLKAKLRSEISSIKNQDLLQQARYKLNKLIFSNQNSKEAMLEIVDEITASEVNRFKNKLFNQSKLRVFAFGNYTNQHIEGMASLTTEHFPTLKKQADIYQTPTINLPEGAIFSWQQNSELSDIALIDGYVIPKSYSNLATARILDKFLHPAFFDQLRTKEQVAYDVSFDGQVFNNQFFVGFFVQSTVADLASIHERIASFRRGFVEKLALVSEEDFITVKNSLLISLNQPAKNLSEEMNHYFDDWQYQNEKFDSKQMLINALENVTKSDVQDFYQRLQIGKDFGRVLIQIRGSNFVDKNFAAPAGATEVQDIDSFHQSMSQ